MKNVSYIILAAMMLFQTTGCQPILPVASRGPSVVASRQTPTAVLETGSISGRLTYNDSGRPARGYMVILSSSQIVLEMVTSTCTDSQGYYAFSNVPAGGRSIVVFDKFSPEPLYYVKSTTVSNTVTSTVNIENIVDLAVQLISPGNGSTLETRRPIFSWEMLPKASEYRIKLEYLADDGYYSDVTLSVLFGCTDCVSVFKGTQLQSLVDLVPGHYRWKVEALAEGSIIAWCDCVNNPEQADCGTGEKDWMNRWEFDIAGQVGNQ